MGDPETIGRYRVVRRIGGGGMGELYLGVAQGLEGFRKLVAIKRLLPALSANEEYVRMFLQEARIAATLDHPNIVNVTDVDRDGEDYYLVMSYLEGGSLEKVIRHWRRQRLVPDYAFCVAVGLGITAGLDYAHRKRDLEGVPLEIVHRDVSPHNIFATYQGEVKLLDFGIAKAASSHVQTAAGVRKGKAGYMAPEQCRGMPLDARTDIFGLGVVLYELSTLRRPFGEGLEDLVVLSKTLEGKFTPPQEHVRDYPPLLAEILSRAMQPDPEDRFESARDMHDALMEFARSEGLDVASRTIARTIEAAVGPRRPPVDASEAVPTGFTELSAPPPIPEFGVTGQTEDPIPSEEPDGPTATEVMVPDESPPVAPTRRRGIGVVIAGAMAAVVIVGGARLFGSSGEAPAAADGGPSAAVSPSTPATPAVDPTSKFTDVAPAQLLRLVNERDLGRVLDYADRQAILKVLAQHPEGDGVDRRLQAMLDLRQAEQASDPCATFAAALRVVESKPDPYYLATLMTVSPPRAGTDCAAVGEHLGRVRNAVEAGVAGRR